MKVRVGDVAIYERIVSEADVAAFVDLSGDDYAAHTDAEIMARSRYGQRLAHGALLVGLMSAAGTQLIHQMQAEGDTTTPVSLGYDRIRFLAPVFFGERVRVTYTVEDVDAERRRSTAGLVATNGGGETVAIATHIMKWLD